jgi:orotidine-5'-phosphate decarboxylase
MNPKKQLIVALDYSSPTVARDLVWKLGDNVIFYKVGWELFLGGGMAFIQELCVSGKRVFLDLKMDDIPETVKRSIKPLRHSGVSFFSLQGDLRTFRAAKLGRSDASFPTSFLYVPVLSSRMGDNFDLDAKMELEIMVKEGIEGVVASGKMVSLIREYFQFNQDLIIVTPGIRQSGQSYDDHRHSMTPTQALQAGATYLVVGRPIRDASDPLEATKSILDEMEAALTSD